MSASLADKAVVVTGGSRGIGRAIVERLCGEGADVVFSYARYQRAAAEVECAVAAAGGSALAVKADFTEPDAALTLMEEARAHLGGLDILVNNAASANPMLIKDMTEEEYDRTMTLNAKSVFLTVQFAARYMRDNGRIVNLSTINTKRPVSGAAAYAGSKGAVEQFTAVAARELGERGITVNTVSPGATDTDQLRAANSGMALRQAVGLTALGRLGEPADVADVVALLVSQDARWVTGQNILADGGIV